jgi:urease accessory protein
VHPPGGVVGGDQLAIKVDVEHGAHALVSTPGAAKWYRANGAGTASRQMLRLHVGADAALEWLPQETIFYDRAEVALEQEISLAAGATYLGCDILCMGRRASGETFARGRIRQRTSIRRGDRLIWWEQGALQGGQLDSPFALHGHSVCATLIAAGVAIPAALVAALRAEAEEQGWPAFGVSQTKDVLTVRHLGDDSESARHIMLAVWRRLRPHLLGREAVTPRIWQT